jgi:pSer/pThr/pTyr-binding forkhead associated (FHA) protein
MWLLKTADDADEPFLFRILPGNIKTIGRAPRADFIVEAPLVSRLHCRLTAGASELEVVDLESTNGTFVNGERVTRVTMRSGDRLGVGRVELHVTRTATDDPPSRAGSEHVTARQAGD